MGGTAWKSGKEQQQKHDSSDEVEKSVKLAEALNINQTPMLLVNGRQVPISGVPYETLKKIIVYQEKLDGIQQ